MIKNFEKLLNEYASLIVKKGINLQSGQSILIRCPVDCYEFLRIVVDKCYESGAKDVVVEYNDPIVSKYNYIYKDENSLKEVKESLILKQKEYVDEGYTILNLISPDVDAFDGVDPKKIQVHNIEQSKKLRFFKEYIISEKTQWCIAGVSSIKWAKKIFKNLSDKKAYYMLWSYIFKCCMIEECYTINNYNTLNSIIKNRAAKLNDYNFEKLIFKNNIGTNLTLYLAKDSIFVGGSEKNLNGIQYAPNLPSYEIFSMPYKNKVDGKVVSSKPLLYQGKLIEDFELEFKDGKVVNYNAKVGYDSLKTLIEFDEGSCYLGEVAIVEHDSPISNLNTLFYNTLYDENASCHLALGDSYPTNLKNGVNLTESEQIKKGANKSLTHVDFMFGTKCMSIDGVKNDGTKINFFKDGKFII